MNKKEFTKVQDVEASSARVHRFVRALFFDWIRGFVGVGILWEIAKTKDGDEFLRMAEEPSKAFANSVLRQIENQSYSTEDVRAIQNYLLGDFRDECWFLASNSFHQQEQVGPKSDEKLNSDSSKLSMLDHESLSHFFRRQEIGSVPNCLLAPCRWLYRRIADSIVCITRGPERLCGLVGQCKREIQNEDSCYCTGSPIAMPVDVPQMLVVQRGPRTYSDGIVVDSRDFAEVRILGSTSDIPFLCPNVYDNTPANKEKNYNE